VILPNGVELSPLIELVAVTPDYYLGTERVGDATFVHGRVFVRWTRHLARGVRAAVDDLAAAHDGPLFVASHQPHNGDHVKFAKFVRLMGFSFLRTVRGTDGADHAVFVRRA
jgi:hypothetical protein